MGKIIEFLGRMQTYCETHGLELPRPVLMPPGVVKELQAELEEAGPMFDAPDQVNDSPYPNTVGKFGKLYVVEDCRVPVNRCLTTWGTMPRVPTDPVTSAFRERIKRSRGG